MDDPTSTPSRAPTSGGAGGAGGAGDDSDNEDEVPDYLRLLSSLQPRSKSSSGIVIPKRGEKDFEPTGFGGQSKLLERSRQAMYQAVSGSRTVGSRSLVRATWNPHTRRARIHDVQGKIFETVGVIRRTPTTDSTGKTVTQATNELLPEEALFLAERGSLQIYTQAEDSDALAPMSLQQAFAALMLASDEAADEPLTREAYLIYAHLKRLGYVVQRASIVDAVRAAPIPPSKARAQGIVADPQRPIKLVTLWDVLLYVPRRIAQLGADAARAVARWMQHAWRNTIGRVLALIGARFARIATSGSRKPGAVGLSLGLGGYDDVRRFLPHQASWTSYDDVFTSMQMVPSGHDFSLPLTSTPTAATGEGEAGLKPFYYAWRPATVYRKSHPPAPEFRIVILNARTTPLPSVWQFGEVFAHIPMPGSDAELIASLPSQGEMGQEEFKQRVEYEKQLKAANDAKNRAAYGKFSEGKQKHLREKAAARQAAAANRAASNAANQGRLAAMLHTLTRTAAARWLWRLLKLDYEVLRMWARLFRHCPPGCWSDKARYQARRPQQRNNAGANVFPPLKAGRRSVVLAIVDGSITTLLRFGESEFAHWRLFGDAAPAITQFA
jgi:tRNA-splicing endonuclease subunit Sen54